MNLAYEHPLQHSIQKATWTHFVEVGSDQGEARQTYAITAKC